MSVPVPEHPGYRCLAELTKEELTAAQQVALLTLRKRNGCELSRAILQRHMTARAGFPDYLVLAQRRLAVRDATGLHALTGLGKVIGGALARELAKEFGITLGLPPRRRRGLFGPGFSQAGNA
jgi:hypothetical protein